MAWHRALATALCASLAWARPVDWRDKYPPSKEGSQEGFDATTDTVGPGVYSGGTKLRADGRPEFAKPQFQDHCQGLGPVYDGTGYPPLSRMISAGDNDALEQYLSEFPNMSTVVLTGGATPLHTAGMSTDGQRAVGTLLKHGADVALDAKDTCGGYTPLQRMASNGLTKGARALLQARADPDKKNSFGQTALKVAEESGSEGIVQLLREERDRHEGHKQRD
mmetsp:Transcript_22955/g.52497  ORF Transcript_22955/g.52497 Transcript_22955/m.52497 type:complete len:222 (-) Transcript_22955:75-740(-)